MGKMKILTVYVFLSLFLIGIGRGVVSAQEISGKYVQESYQTFQNDNAPELALKLNNIKNQRQLEAKTLVELKEVSLNAIKVIYQSTWEQGYYFDNLFTIITYIPDQNNNPQVALCNSGNLVKEKYKKLAENPALFIITDNETLKIAETDEDIKKKALEITFLAISLANNKEGVVKQLLDLSKTKEMVNNFAEGSKYFTYTKMSDRKNPAYNLPKNAGITEMRDAVRENILSLLFNGYAFSCLYSRYDYSYRYAENFVFRVEKGIKGAMSIDENPGLFIAADDNTLKIFEGLVGTEKAREKIRDISRDILADINDSNFPQKLYNKVYSLPRSKTSNELSTERLNRAEKYRLEENAQKERQKARDEKLRHQEWRERQNRK